MLSRKEGEKEIKGGFVVSFFINYRLLTFINSTKGLVIFFCYEKSVSKVMKLIKIEKTFLNSTQ